jgi:hypothetical protein
VQNDNGNWEDEHESQEESGADPVDGRFRDAVVGCCVLGDRSKGEPLQQSVIERPFRASMNTHIPRHNDVHENQLQKAKPSALVGAVRS